MCKGFVAQLNAQLKVILKLKLNKENGLKLNCFLY